MGERPIRINGTNEVNVEINATGDATIFLPAEGGTLAIQSAIPGGIAAGTQTGSTGTIVFSNSNGVTFGMTDSSVVTAAISSLVFSNSNSFTFGINNSTLTASFSQSNQAFSAGAASSTFQTLSFQDSNGVSFSNNAGGVRVSHDLQFTSNTSNITSAALHTSASRVINLVAATNNTGGGTASLSSNVSFSNANNVTFYTSAGNAIAASFSQSVDTNKAGTGATTAAANAGVSATLNTNGLSISVTSPAQTNQTVGLYALGNTTQNSSTTLDARSISYNGLGAATVGYSNGSVQISVPVQSADTNKAGTGATTAAANAGVSATLNTNGLSISVTSPAQSNQNISLFALGNTTQNSSTVLNASNLSFNGIGIVSLGYSNGSIQVSATQSVDTNKAGTGATTAAANAGVSATLNTNGLSISVTSPAQTNQTVGLFALGNSTQNSSTTLDARSISYNGLGIVSVGYSNGSVQLSATQSNQAFSAGAASSTFQTLSLQDSNGISFSNNAGAIRLTHDLQFTSNTSNITSAALHTSASRVINIVAATNNTGGGTASLSSNVSFSNANNVTFYTSAGGAIAASFSQSVDTNKAGTGATTAAANAGVSATLNTNGLSISVTAPAQTNQTVGLFALGNTTQNSSTTLDARSISYNGLGIVSVGYSNGSVQVSATQSNQNISLYALGNTTQNSSTVLNASNLSFNGIGNASVGFSNGSIQISVTAAGGAGITAINASAGTTSNNLTNIVFADLNGISFGLNGSTITGSHNGLTSQSNQAFSAGAASSTFQTLAFQDSNGVSFSNNAGAVRISHDLQFTSNTSNITSAALHTSASRVINIVAATDNTGGGTSSLSSNVSFTNANNVTFYTSAGGAIAASFSQSVDTNKAGTGATTAAANAGVSATLNTNGLSISVTSPAQTNQTIGLYALGNTTQNSSSTMDARTLSFNGLGIITVGYSNGSIQISATQSNQAFSAGAASSTFQTITFQDSNGVSFSNNAGAIRLTHDLQFTSNTSNITSAALHTSASRVFNIVAATNSTGGGTSSLSSNVSFSAANGVTFYTSAGGAIVGSVNTSYAASNHSHGNPTLALTNLSGTTASNSAGLTLSLSAAAPGGGGAINVSAGTTSGNLQTLQFDDGNGVSWGLNGSTITASVNAGGGDTRSFYNPYGDLVMVAGQVGQGTLNINPNDFPNISFDRVYMPINITNSSNSSGSHTLSFWLGIYTRNVSTLSLIISQSTSYALTHSGTAGSYSLYSGMRHISMGISTSLPEGLYYMGVLSRTTSGGANGSYSQFVVSNLNSNFLGHFSSAHNTTMQFRPGIGVYSATTSGMPSSIGISQLRGSDSAAQRPPIVIFANSTI